MKTIVFDFDGVIVDSEPIKQAGYAEIFSEFGEDVPHAVVEDIKKGFADGRGNRTDIIRTILERLHADDLDAKTKAYVQRYGDVVEKKVRALEVAPDTRNTLERLCAQYPLYINSMTPEDALRGTTEALGITKYFKGVFGAPNTKVENLQRIASAEHAEPNEILFVGDSGGDYRAAEEFGCTFIGVATDLNGWSQGQPFDVVSSLLSLEDIVTGRSDA